MSYQSLVSKAQPVLEDYKNKRSCCCWRLPDSNKADYLLGMISKLDEQELNDIEKETLLLVALGGLRHYLEDKKNTKFGERIEAVMAKASEAAVEKFSDSDMVDVISQVKTNIQNYGSVEMVKMKSVGSPLERLKLASDDTWPDTVIRIVNEPASNRTPIFTIT